MQSHGELGSSKPRLTLDYNLRTYIFEEIIENIIWGFHPPASTPRRERRRELRPGALSQILNPSIPVTPRSYTPGFQIRDTKITTPYMSKRLLALPTVTGAAAHAHESPTTSNATQTDIHILIADENSSTLPDSSIAPSTTPHRGIKFHVEQYVRGAIMRRRLANGAYIPLRLILLLR